MPSDFGEGLDSRNSINQRSGIYTEGSVATMILLSLAFGGFELLIHIQYSEARDSHPTGATWISRLLGDTVTIEYQSQCQLFLMASCLSMLMVYIVAVTAFWLPQIAAIRLDLQRMQFGLLVFMALISVPAMVALAGAVYRLAAAFLAMPAETRLVDAKALLMFTFGCFAVLTFVVLLVGSWANGVSKQPANAFFIYFRTFSLRSGLCPLVPLLCVAMAAFLWGLCMFRRVRLIDGLQLPKAHESEPHGLYFLDLTTDSFCGIGELQDKVTGFLYPGRATPDVARSHFVCFSTQGSVSPVQLGSDSVLRWSGIHHFAPDGA